MNHAKRRLRTLSLSFLAVLGLMALSAVAAQASGTFLLLNPGATFATEKVTEVTATGVQKEAGRLFIPERGIEIVCQKADVSSGKLSATVAHATILFKECLVHATKTITGGKHGPVELIVGDTTLTKCIIQGTGGETNGSILVKVKGLPITHGGQDFVLFSPLEAAGGDPLLFTTLQFLPGLGCAFPLITSIKGHIVGQINAGQVSEQEITFNPAITLLFQAVGLPGDKLTYGAFQSYIEGKVTLVKTTGPAGFVAVPWGLH